MKHPTRKVLVGGVVSSLMLGTGAVTASAAAPAVRCGQAITSNTKLKRNVGPCPGDGLVVKANNVRLDLNGFKVSGANGTEETNGIRLMGTSGVTVKDGTVTGFDAGVNVMGGSGNTLTDLAVRGNVNDNITTDNPADDCTFGDGITTTDSDDNAILDNSVIRNGPFSGISLVGDSDGNVVKGNDVRNNNLPNEDAAPGSQGNGNCGAPFSRPIQDIGIRIEGPGANANQVERNRVTNSAIGGITVHGYVYAPRAREGEPLPPPDNPNTDNVVSGNYVADTGKETYTVDRLADGIGVLRQGPASVVGVSQDNTIVGNTVVRSKRHGIFLGQPTQPGPIGGNTVTRNVVQNSLLDGIRVNCSAPGPPGSPPPACAINNTLTRNQAHDNGEYDARDDNPDCDDNAWSKNVFGFVNQECVDFDATVGTPPAPAAAAAAQTSAGAGKPVVSRTASKAEMR